MLRSLSPSAFDIARLPTAAEIVQFRELQSFVTEDKEADQEFRNIVQPVIANLQPKIITLSTLRTQAVLSQIPMPDQTPASSSSTDQASTDRLELATSVFTCACLPHYYTRSNGCLQGLKALGHSCYQKYRYPGGDSLMDCVPLFSSNGKATVEAMLEHLNLDKNTTTIADLDHLDHRFTCLSCPISRENPRARRKINRGELGRRAMTWRGLVSFCVFCTSLWSINTSTLLHHHLFN